MRWHYSVNTAGVLDPSVCSSRARVGLDGGLTAVGPQPAAGQQKYRLQKSLSDMAWRVVSNKTLNTVERFTSLNTEERFTSLNTEERFTSLNTVERFTSLNTVERFTSLNTEERFTSLNTEERFTSLNTVERFTSLNTVERFTSLNTVERFTSLNTVGSTRQGTERQGKPSLLRQLRDLGSRLRLFKNRLEPWLRYEPISRIPGCGAAWRRGYPLTSKLREPTNPLSRMPRFHRAMRYCSLQYSAALFAYIGVSVAHGLPAAGQGCPRPGCLWPGCEVLEED
ncbi:unnamed protein product [Boreogadus saida]